MSWLDKIKNQLIITCGDGKPYTPSWLNASKQLDWNVAEFNFPGIDGTLVKKSKKIGTKYNLELYFQGENHLDISAAFEASCNDSRPWTMEHPFYGQLIVQAPSLHVDNSGLNISKWTGIVIETITEENPITKPNAIDAISVQKDLCDIACEEVLTAIPSSTDVSNWNNNNSSIFNLSIPILKIPEGVELYFNLFNAANSAVNTAIASPLLAIRTTIAMVNAPAMFTLSVKQRLDLLVSQFNVLRANISGLTTPASKQIYQSHAGSIFSTMALATSLPIDGDFSNNKKAFDSISTITTAYQLYLADLDLLQTINGGNTTSFIPDANLQFQINQIINLAVSNLFSIALNSKVERSIITETDTNIIILTHRFYGLDSFDNNINELIENNGFGLKSLLQIKKGTVIIYYI